MLDKLENMMKSMVDNGYYTSDTIELNMKIRNGYKTLEIVDFYGLGLTWEEAFEELHKNYIDFMKEEEKKEEAILSALNI